MKVGTKSVLFGAHCFLIHPWFVFAAWWKLYGFPFDPRLWVAFFVHDLGYWGKPNMDGEEGEKHPVWGARLMHKLFDYKSIYLSVSKGWISVDKDGGTAINGSEYFYPIIEGNERKWFDFCLYHSRFYAKKKGVQPSKLCYADKLAICLEPSWFYLLRVNLSGEVKEYMALAKLRTGRGEPATKYESMRLNGSSQLEWFRSMKEYLRRWVNVHKNGEEDTWTPQI